MALVIGEWRFQSGAVPDLPAIADALRRAMRLEVTEEGAGREAALFVPKLGERLFDWQLEPDRIAVHSFAPAHPYLWEHLDAVLGAAGGRIGEAAQFWRPDPARATLRRPWPELTLRERFLLRLPTIAASRPHDRLLPRADEG